MVNSFKDFLKLPFNNVGGKIKTLALVCCWIEILLCVIAGICIMVGGISFGRWLGLDRVIYDVGGFIIGVAVIIIGSVLSIISSYGLYAFGTLVENSELLGNISIKQY